MLVKKFDTPKPKCLLYNHRVSSNSNIPDLETNNDNAGNPPPPRIDPIINGMSQQSQQQPEKQPTKQPEIHTIINIQPHTEVLLKKKEVLQEIADHEQAIKKAKVWVQAKLLSMLCFAVVVYLTIKT